MASDNRSGVSNRMARNAAIILVLGLTVTAIRGQATDYTLRTFGSRPVTDAEITQIAELVAATGKPPWLLRTPHSMIPDVRIAELFLEPDVLGTRVHRGRMLSLGTEGPRFGPPRSPWTIRDSRSYAYVPTPGRQAGEIRSERDTNWPFTVEGVFDDDILISLVEFIRAQPRLPNVPEGQAPNQVSGAPIAVIARRGDGVIVAQRTGDLQGERIWLVHQDGRWVITKLEMWIA